MHQNVGSVKKNRGPKTVPCRTQYFISLETDKFFTQTYCTFSKTYVFQFIQKFVAKDLAKCFLQLKKIYIYIFYILTCPLM